MTPFREAGLMTALLYLVLGLGCFGMGVTTVVSVWGPTVQGAFVLDWVFAAGCIVIVGWIRWVRRATWLSDFGWLKPTGWIWWVVAVVYGTAWAALGYARGGDPLAITWQRPIMMAIGVFLAFAEELAVRGVIMDSLRREGCGSAVQVMVSALIIGGYHGIVGASFHPAYAIASAVLFGGLSVLYIASGRSLGPVLLAHALTHVLGDPALMQGILIGAAGPR